MRLRRGSRRLVARPLAVTLSSLAVASGCGGLFGVDFDAATLDELHPDATTTSPSATDPTPGDPGVPQHGDAAAPDADSSTGASRCDEGGEGRLLECAPKGCGAVLYDDVLFAESFGPGSTWAQTFTSGTFAPPVLGPDGLHFGPHDLSGDWRAYYTPATTTRKDFGDVLYCVRLRIDVIAATTAQNTLEISMRGGSEGMVLTFGTTKGYVALTSKRGEGDWAALGSVPHTFPVGSDDLELALYGRGDDFWAEVKDEAAGTVEALATHYALPATGPVELLGYQIPKGVVVSRVAVGRPSAGLDRPNRPATLSVRPRRRRFAKKKSFARPAMRRGRACPWRRGARATLTTSTPFMRTSLLRGFGLGFGLLGTFATAACAPADDGPSSAGSTEDLATSTAATTRAARCAPHGPGGLLECSNRCPTSIFAKTDRIDDFQHENTYATEWSSDFARPKLAPQGLVFGPHPGGAPWWDTYSPTWTNDATFGDVLTCVRFHVTLDAVGPQPQEANGLELSLRGGSMGMVLSFAGAARRAVLTTKTSDSDAWQEHDSRPFPLAAGEHDIELALYGEGNAFTAELKDVGTGQTTALSAWYALPPQGTVQLLGWQLPHPLTVERVVTGIPTRDAKRRIGR